MKVLQISTPFLPVTPNLNYGGTERGVYLLERELEKLGYSEGVVAPGDSKPSGLLHKTIDASIGVDNEDELRDRWRNNYLKFVHIQKCLDYLKNLSPDIAHLHDENLLFFERSIAIPTVLTLHSDFDLFWDKSLKPFVEKRKTKFIAISNCQKKLYKSNGIEIDYVVYNGVNEDSFSISSVKLDYLLTLSSIQPRKGQRDAIEIGKRTGLDIIIAGNIGDARYFEQEIKPNITHDLTRETDKLSAYMSLSSSSPKVVYVGSVNDSQKAPLFSHAKAFLMPLKQSEPFGLVMVEAMMSGTLVLGYDIGSVSEIITEECGIVVPLGNLEEMARSVRSLEQINPLSCRKIAIDLFGKQKMADNYIQVYQDILSQSN